MPTTADPAALAALFARVWARGPSKWSVAELKSLGFIQREENGRRLGQVLAELADRGSGAGRWAVARVDLGGKKLAEGRLWSLRLRW